MIKKILIWTLLPWCFAAAANAANAADTAGTTAAADAAPTAAAVPVEQLHRALIAAMKGGKRLGYRGRYDKLKPVVENSFDFPFIARLILGPDWDKLSGPQRQSLEAALAKLSLSSYAREFDGYSGESFQRMSARALGNDVLERYLFKPSSGDVIHFDYQLHRSAAGWKIANVVVDGVSDLALKRGQYRKLFQEKGFEGLIAWIDKQIADNAGDDNA
ncbi:MAG: ABC transporter substrate-binding protein [Gammaproteobacteria bacterium]|nr:ABC transporter substrate-binding protein [Gammaproteobacteria bacterium]